MARGKYRKKQSVFPLRWGLVCVLLLVALIGGTSAYLSMSSEPSNSLTVAADPQVTVSGTKIIVEPVGYPVYVRMAVDPYWVNKSGNILAEEPPATAWSVDGDVWDEHGGFYYYRSSITQKTELTAVTLTTMKNGEYELAVTVAAQVVQAVGEMDNSTKPAVQDAWGVNLLG